MRDLEFVNVEITFPDACRQTVGISGEALDWSTTGDQARLVTECIEQAKKNHQKQHEGGLHTVPMTYPRDEALDATACMGPGCVAQRSGIGLSESSCFPESGGPQDKYMVKFLKPDRGPDYPAYDPGPKMNTYLAKDPIPDKYYFNGLRKAELPKASSVTREERDAFWNKKLEMQVRRAEREMTMWPHNK